MNLGGEKMFEWLKNNIISPFTAGLITILLGYLKFTISKQHKKKAKSIKKKLYVYGKIKNLCQKYDWKKIKKKDLIQGFVESMDDNYIYFEPSLIIKMSNVIKGKNEENDKFKEYVTDVENEIDKVYQSLRKKSGYTVSIDAPDPDYYIDLFLNGFLFAFLFYIVLDILAIVFVNEKMVITVINMFFVFLFVALGLCIIGFSIWKFCIAIKEFTKSRRNF